MTDATSRVPNEILWACMDYLSLVDIVRIMGMSRRWHRLSINHEKYWKYLSISSSSDAATQWFLLRLSRTRLRLITVDARLVDADPVNLVCILHAVTAHLAYIQSLVFCVSFGHCYWLFDALGYPAYNMEQLTLRVDIDLITPRLPDSLLMGTAPKLFRLATQNISTRHIPIGMFPSVKEIEFGFHDQYDLTDVQASLEALVSVRDLTLTGRPCVDDPSAIDAAVFGNLERLSLHLDYPMPKHVLLLLPICRIQHVVYSAADASAVSALMDYMDGKLDLHVQPEEKSNDAYFVHVVEPSTARVRSFAESTRSDSGDAPSPCDVFSRVDITARIVFLSLPTTFWHIIPLTLLLPALTELRLILPHDDSMDGLPVQKLHCPELQRLTLRSGNPQLLHSIAPQMLASFISHSLAGVPFPIAVVLEGIKLSSAGTITADIVRSIEHGSTSSRTYFIDHRRVLA